MQEQPELNEQFREILLWRARKQRYLHRVRSRRCSTNVAAYSPRSPIFCNLSSRYGIVSGKPKLMYCYLRFRNNAAGRNAGNVSPPTALAQQEMPSWRHALNRCTENVDRNRQRQASMGGGLVIPQESMACSVPSATHAVAPGPETSPAGHSVQGGVPVLLKEPLSQIPFRGFRHADTGNR